MPRLIDRAHVRFIVLDRDDETGEITVQDIVEPKIGASPFFWRRWLRDYAGRPEARVEVESLSGSFDHRISTFRRSIPLASYVRSPTP